MKEDYTIESVVSDDCATTPRARCHLVHAFEAELNGRFTVTFCLLPADVTANVAELEVAEPILGEVDVAGVSRSK